MKRTVLEQVWNPTQHIALWLAAWLTGQEGYDHLTDALDSLGGPGTASGSFVLADAVIPDVIDVETDLSRAEFLRLVRAVTESGDWENEERPLVRLILSGPGFPPHLPAGTEAASQAALAGSAIVIADATPGWWHVLVPVPATDSSENIWNWYTLEDFLPEPAHLSPGEADLVLADAARQAARDLMAMNRGADRSRSFGGNGAGVNGARKIPDPRLLVGMLDDHLDLAYLPDALPRRAATVLARADRLSSILTVAQGNESGVGTADYDPHLIPLWHKVRQARMSAVEYTVRQWQQGGY